MGQIRGFFQIRSFDPLWVEIWSARWNWLPRSCSPAVAYAAVPVPSSPPSVYLVPEIVESNVPLHSYWGLFLCRLEIWKTNVLFGSVILCKWGKLEGQNVEIYRSRIKLKIYRYTEKYFFEHKSFIIHKLK